MIYEIVRNVDEDYYNKRLNQPLSYFAVLFAPFLQSMFKCIIKINCTSYYIMLINIHNIVSQLCIYRLLQDRNSFVRFSISLKSLKAWSWHQIKGIKYTATMQSKSRGALYVPCQPTNPICGGLGQILPVRSGC